MTIKVVDLVVIHLLVIITISDILLYLLFLQLSKLE